MAVRADEPAQQETENIGTPRSGPGLRAAVWQIAWPVVAEQALATVTQVVDMAMVGHLSTVAVTAVGLFLQPFWFVSSLFLGLSIGATALVARAVGARDAPTAARVTGQTVAVATVLGTMVAGVGYNLATPIMVLMGAAPEVIPEGSVYVRAVMPGMPFFFVFTVLAGCLRGAGDTRTPLYVNGALNLIHIFLNWVLIFGHLGVPALGVAGAGISTSLSRALGGAALVTLVMTGRAGLRVHPREVVGLDLRLIWRVLRVGMPAAAERALASGGQLVYARMVASLGTVAYAAHSLCLNAESFSYMPGLGFATAASALVGQHLGAGRPRDAERSTLVALRFAIATMGGMGVLFLAVPGSLLRIYTTDPQVIALGVILMRIVAFTQIPEAVGFVLPGALRGAGDTLAVLGISMVGMWVTRIGLTHVLAFALGLGLPGAWVAMLADWSVRSLLFLARFRSGAWKSLRV